MLQNKPGARYPNGRGRMFGWFVGIVISAVVMSSGALSQQSFQQLESVSQFEQALAAVDAIKHRKQSTLSVSFAEATRGHLFSQLRLNRQSGKGRAGVRTIVRCG